MRCVALGEERAGSLGEHAKPHEIDLLGIDLEDVPGPSCQKDLRAVREGSAQP